MSKDILPKNKKGELHGYCESHHENGQLRWKGVCVNSMMCGYHESYRVNGKVDRDYTSYWMSGNKVSVDNKEGYCYIWCREVLDG